LKQKSEVLFGKNIYIDGREIGPKRPCYIIAEAGVAHFGSLKKGFALIDVAVEAGTDAVKFQLFKTNELIGPSSKEWRERLRPRELSIVDMAKLREYADCRGITFLCTAHDESSLKDVYQVLNVPAIKIGSGEVENWPFLAKAAAYQKPLILSTGMYSLKAIRTALKVIAEAGCRDLAVLHCVTAYPVPPEETNLRVMSRIRRLFSGPVGYSDHTAGTVIPLAAVALGAHIIEKHITLDVNVPNAQDWKVSCTPKTLGPFVNDVRTIESSLRSASKRMTIREQQSVFWARKSITAAIPIRAGSEISLEMLCSQRPGTGLPPSRLPEVLGQCATRDIEEGEIISLAMIEQRI